MQKESLKNKTINGVGWSAADAFLGQGVTFIVGLVLARLLSPDEYGLIGICLIFTTVLNGIVDSGFSKALIRRTDVTNADYNTMFILNMVMSVILYLLLYLSAPYIADFFHRPVLVAMIRCIGLVLIANAMSIVQVTILTKVIDFKTKTKASLISAIVSGLLGILLALCGFGVWALVVQQLAKQFIYTLCLWLLNKWYPKIVFRKSSFIYMWGFGWKLLLSNLIDSIWSQLYQVVVGKFYSPYTLGQYTRSQEYASVFSQNFTSIVQRVSYPALAEIQNEPERLLCAYRKVIKTTMLVTCFFMFLLGSIAEPLIYCLIGPKWQIASTFLPLICANMSLYPLHAINLNVLQIKGRSDLFLYIEIVKKIIAIIPICIGIFIGIYQMLWFSILTGILSFFVNSFYSGKSIGYSSFAQLKDVMPNYLLAFVVASIVYSFKYIAISYWIILPIQCVSGLLLFVVFCEIMKINEYDEIKSILKSYIYK